MPCLLRLAVLTLLPASLCGVALGAEDLPTPATTSSKSVQYKRADANFYARGDVMRADADAVILPPTAFAQNGDLYTYTPKKKAPKTVYVEAPNDWIEPITPPDMPASLNIAFDAMQVREPHGDVEVAMPNAPTTFAPAADGQPLPNGAVVKTGANSTAAILFGGVDSARLMPNSEAAVQQAVASTSRAAEVDLTSGGVFSKVGTQVGVDGEYQVHTPYGTALSSGGDFVAIILTNRTDLWVAQGGITLLQPDGQKFGTVSSNGTGPLKLIRYPAISGAAESQRADEESLNAIFNFIPFANQKLAALHTKAAQGVPLTANEQAYLQRIKQVPALFKLDLIVPPPSELDVLADGTVSFQGETLSLVELGAKLKDYVVNGYEPKIVVKAGQGATYAGFQAALDACKAATGLQYKVAGDMPAKPAPPPPPPAPPAPPKPLEVVVHSDGTIKFQGATLTSDEFTAKIKAAVTASPDVPLNLHPDPKLSYVTLSSIIDACKAAGPKTLNLNLPPAKELTVTVHGDGSIEFHNASLALDAFGADIKAAVALRPDLPIVVHSNPKADYAKFKAVTDACNDAQAKQVTIVQPAPQPPPPPKLDAFVQADGSIKFQGAVLKLDDFTAKIKAAVAATPDAPITVNPDPKASYAAVAAVVDAIKNSGAKSFTFHFPSARELTVAAHEDGSILFHGAKLNIDEFAQEIKAAVALLPNVPIVVHSNPKMDYAKFETIVDACKGTGAKEVTLVPPTPQPPKPKPAPVVAATPAPKLPVTAETPPTPAPAPAPKPVAPPQPLAVIAHADGTIKFEGKTMKLDEFTAKIKDAATANPALAVIIHSNPKMDYAKFEAVVDACKNAPAKEVDVVPPAPQPPPPNALAGLAPLAMPKLAIKPPPPAEKPAVPAGPQAVIVHADGSIKFQGKMMKLDEFTAKIKDAATADPTLAVIIHSNPKMDYAKFEAVVDACKSAPAKEVNIVPPAPQPPLPVTAETPPAPALPKPPMPSIDDQLKQGVVPVELGLDAGGQIEVMGIPTDEEGLKTRLEGIAAANPNQPIVLVKKKGVTHVQWIHVVDLVHAAKLRVRVYNEGEHFGPPAPPNESNTPPAVVVTRPPAAEGGPTLQTPETPAAANAAPVITQAEEAVPVEIELTPDGQVSFLGEAVTETELKARLDSVAQGSTKEPVLIVKDEKVSHAQLQHVLDLCHAAKLKVKIKTVKSSDTGALKPHAPLPVALAPTPAEGSAPEAAAPGGEKILPVEIGLASKGRLTFEGASVSLDELKARLATVAQGNPNQPVVIVKASDVPDDSADALETVCEGVSPQLKISVRSAPSFAPPSLPDNSPAANLPAPDVHLHAALDGMSGTSR